MWGVGAVLSRSRSLSGDKADRGELLLWLLLCILNCSVYLQLYFYLQTVHLFGIALNSFFLRTLPPAPLSVRPSTVTYLLPCPTPQPPASFPLLSLCPRTQSGPFPGALSLSAPHFSSSAGTLPVCTLCSHQPELCMSDSLPSCGYGPGL